MMRVLRNHVLALLGSVFALALASPSHAEQWTGATSSNWAIGSNWLSGVVPTAGAPVNISTITPNATIASGISFAGGYMELGFGAGSTGNLSLTNSSVFSVTGMHVGQDGTGILNITDSQLSSASFIWVGNNMSGVGTINVSGPTALLDVPATFIDVGNWGKGTLNITNGGHVNSYVGYIGDNAGQGGDVLISGAGSLWSIGRFLGVGGDALAVVRVENGAGLTVNGEAGVGYNNNANNAITVTGLGSYFTAIDLPVGIGGVGYLNVLDQASVTATTVYVGYLSGSSGIVQVSGSGPVRSRVTASQFLKTNGAAAVLVDGGVIAASIDQANFFSNFTAGDITLQSGGMIFDTNGHAVGISAPLGGIGGLTKAGAGTLTLSSSNSYQGGTFVTSGTLVTSLAGFNGPLDISSGATFRFAGASNGAYAGVLSGVGNLVLNGGGNIALSANSSGFGGTTSVTGTTLSVNDLGGTVQMNAGSRLVGTGRVGNLALGSGSVIAPGNPIGTISVAGNLSFDPNAVYEVQIAGSTAADLINVAGNAALAGNVEVSAVDAQTSYQNGSVYRILNASSITGGFAGVVSQSAFLDLTMVQGSDRVDLLMGLKDGGMGPAPDSPWPVLFAKEARTRNQSGAAIALDAFDQSGDALTVYNQILMLNADDARTAFDLASGEIHAGSQQMIAQSFALFNATLTTHRHGLRGVQSFSPPLGYASAAPTSSVAAIAGVVDDRETGPDHGVWLTPVFGRGFIDSDGKAARMDWTAGGVAAGYEGAARLGAGDARFGVGLGYLGSEADIGARLSHASADGVNAGVYGDWSNGALALSGSLAYGANHLETERGIVIGSLSRTARADYWSNCAALALGAGYRLAVTDKLVLAPTATLSADWTGHGGATETGAGALNASIAPSSAIGFDTGIGLVGGYDINLASGGVLTLEAQAMWQHGFGETARDQGISLAGGGNSFEVESADAGRDRLQLGAGLVYQASDRLDISARYNGVLSSRQQSHGGQISLHMAF